MAHNNDATNPSADIDEHEPVVNLKEELQPVADVTEEMQPVVNIKQELQGTDHGQSTKAERLGDREAGYANGMTLDQIDFLSFLEALMALVEKAAKLWKPDEKLPIGVAASSEQLISLASLLDEEEREKRETQRGSTPWATTTSRDGEKSYPKLAKGWVDALERAEDRGEAWRKLAALPVNFANYLNLLYFLPDPRSHQRLANPAYREPLSDAFPRQLRASHMPHAFALLSRGLDAFQNYRGEPDQISPADLPLVTIIGLYFFSLVLAKDAMLQPALMHDARNTVCAQLDECLAILPRLIRDKCFSDEQAEAFRDRATSMKHWAHACREPISLGDIHVYARVYWTWWYGQLIASNSRLLQTFLYLCEKRHLEAAVDQGATGLGGVGDNDDEDNNNEDDDERLLKALLEDSRVAPLLLKNGRPQTVLECITALQDWCFVSTNDGETISLSSAPNTETESRQKMVERSCLRRRTSLLSQEIMDTRHMGLHIDIRTRLCERGDKADVDAALERYLIRETTAPNCLQLEQALCTTLQKLPVWADICVQNVLTKLHSNEKWQKAILENFDHGIHAVCNKNATSPAYGTIKLSLLEPAIIRAALGVPGYNDSLKSALAGAIAGAVGWKASWNEELFQETMPGWKNIFQAFKIKELSEEHDIQVDTCIMCLMPLDLEKGRRPKNKKARKLLQQQRSRQWSEAVGAIFKNFMNEARPVFEQAYGKKASTTPGGIEVPIGRMAI
ncbi:hypothetical protein CSOJ01_15681 [Colletotrichum sojae]|uniref:Uncharacterized protein n=1 Tax=Colletotrichum sojae TaxID=2175907 RepID=A0A8H6MH46_9PEZI|nr:hypothetical protein CSOJ01_15681 [Colletotrichum sojae]